MRLSIGLKSLRAVEIVCPDLVRRAIRRVSKS